MDLPMRFFYAAKLEQGRFGVGSNTVLGNHNSAQSRASVFSLSLLDIFSIVGVSLFCYGPLICEVVLPQSRVL